MHLSLHTMEIFQIQTLTTPAHSLDSLKAAGLWTPISAEFYRSQAPYQLLGGCRDLNGRGTGVIHLLLQLPNLVYSEKAVSGGVRSLLELSLLRDLGVET